MRHDPVLTMRSKFWLALTHGLHQRTEGLHEAGAFLLGRRDGAHRDVTSVVYYDDLDQAAYATGVCVLYAPAFAQLWDNCRNRHLEVIADVHVHGFSAGQSLSDQRNPMIARAGHIALILPLMAAPPVRRWSIGVYEYLGDHEWRALGGCNTRQILKLDEAT